MKYYTLKFGELTRHLPICKVTDSLYIAGFVLLRCDFCHLVGNVNAGNGSHIPLQVIRKQNAGTAGHIQNVLSFLDAGIVQNPVDDTVPVGLVCIPTGGITVKKGNDITFIHRGFLRFSSFGLFYMIIGMVSIFDIVLSYYIHFHVPAEAPWGDVSGIRPTPMHGKRLPDTEALLFSSGIWKVVGET